MSGEQMDAEELLVYLGAEFNSGKPLMLGTILEVLKERDKARHALAMREGIWVAMNMIGYAVIPLRNLMDGELTKHDYNVKAWADSQPGKLGVAFYKDEQSEGVKDEI